MIRFEHLAKSFDGRVVLADVSFEVPAGTTMVVLGRSGTGKSVLLKHVVGLMKPDAGRVVVDDIDVTALDDDGLVELRRRIGYVFQFAALFDGRTCGDNIRMGLVRQGLDPSEVERRVADSLALVGLPDVMDRMPAELSGGMRKRVGIARAVALQPRYILWDEPTTGLDPVTTATMDLLMQRVSRELGVTSIVVTHDLRSAFNIADRIALLHEGTVRAIGTADELMSSTDRVVRQFLEGRPE